MNSSVITKDILKPSLTYSADKDEGKDVGQSEAIMAEQKKAIDALEVFEETISTPTRARYSSRLQEGYDKEDQSSCFDICRKMYQKAHPGKVGMQQQGKSAFDILADGAATKTTEPQSGLRTFDVYNRTKSL